jgi:hypothetical protein
MLFVRANGLVSSVTTTHTTQPQTMTSPVHDAVPSFFTSSLFNEIHNWLNEVAPECTIRPSVNAKVPLDGVSIPAKVPDAAVRVEPDGMQLRCPQMVIEVGYSQTIASLRRDAENWLAGSSGECRSVVVVKFHKPKSIDFGNWEKWTGWMEIWVRSTTEP